MRANEKKIAGTEIISMVTNEQFSGAFRKKCQLVFGMKMPSDLDIRKDFLFKRKRIAWNRIYFFENGMHMGSVEKYCRKTAIKLLKQFKIVQKTDKGVEVLRILTLYL